MSRGVWPHGDPDAVVRAVLRQRIFRLAPATARSGRPSLWSTLWGWFMQHVVHPLWAPFAHAFAVSRGAGTALGIALIVVALAALLFAGVRLALAFARPQRTHSRERAREAASVAERVRSAAQWRTIGTRAAARGNHAEAIAAFFAAALAFLDERGLVTFAASRTPGEYRRSVGRACAAAAASFDELAQHFSRAAYGTTLPQVDASVRAEQALEAFMQTASVAPWRR